MADDNSVNVSIGADVADIKSALDDLKSSFGDLGNAAGKSADQANEHLSRISESANVIKQTFEDVGDALGISFGVDKLVDFIKSEADLGEQLTHTSEKLGITTTQASALQDEAIATGTSFDGLVLQLGRLELNLESNQRGTSRVQQGFKALGLSAKSFIGMPIPEQLERIAEATSKFADGGNKSAAVLAILGRAGLDMLPFLDRGKSGFEELSTEIERAGSVLSGPEVAGMMKVKEDINEMSLAWQGFKNKIFDVLGPSVDQAIQWLTGLMEHLTPGDIQSGVDKIVDVLAEAAKAVVGFAATALDAWDRLQQSMNSASKFPSMSAMAKYMANPLADMGVGAQNPFKQFADSNAQNFAKIDADTSAFATKWSADIDKVAAAAKKFNVLPADPGALISSTNQYTAAMAELKDKMSGVTSGAPGASASVSKVGDAARKAGEDAGGAALKLKSLQSLFSIKPQAGTMDIGIPDQSALNATINDLNAEVEKYKGAQKEEQIAIEEKVKMKTESERKGSDDVIASLNTEKTEIDSVYAKELSAAAGNAEKISEIKKAQVAFDQEMDEKIAQQNADAAEKTKESWDKAFSSLDSAFTGQISGLLQGTETWHQAFQKVLLSLTTDVISFFLKWAMQQAETVAMGIAQNGALTAAVIAADASQTASHTAAAAASNTAGLASMEASLAQDASRVFGGVFAFLAPEMGPEAASIAALDAAIVEGAQFAQGSWALDQDGMATVHAGEMIVPKAQTPWAQDLMANAASAGSAGARQAAGDTHYHISPTINLPLGATGMSAKSLREKGGVIADVLKEQVKRGAFRGFNHRQ